MNNIYYLGPKGSYSYKISSKLFDENNLSACNSFADIVKKTLGNVDSTGILPIENSITSNIHENMDYLFKENMTVTGEAFLKIHLDLIGFEGADLKDIKKVYSHKQALSQCRGYIIKHNLTMQETSSTAAAKNLILKINDKRVGFMGNSELADGDKLKILDKDVGDEKYNVTRFLFVSGGGKHTAAKNQNKASIVFTIPHKPGSLATLLTEFGKTNLNLTKIESRPVPSTDWEYRFWIDLENNTPKRIDETILDAILKNNTKNYKIIGIYPAGEIYE